MKKFFLLTTILLTSGTVFANKTIAATTPVLQRYEFTAASRLPIAQNDKNTTLVFHVDEKTNDKPSDVLTVYCHNSLSKVNPGHTLLCQNATAAEGYFGVLPEDFINGTTTGVFNKTN
jgi:hypothetical protein